MKSTGIMGCILRGIIPKQDKKIGAHLVIQIDTAVNSKTLALLYGDGDFTSIFKLPFLLKKSAIGESSEHLEMNWIDERTGEVYDKMMIQLQSAVISPDGSARLKLIKHYTDSKSLDHLIPFIGFPVQVDFRIPQESFINDEDGKNESAE